MHRTAFPPVLISDLREYKPLLHFRFFLSGVRHPAVRNDDGLDRLVLLGDCDGHTGGERAGHVADAQAGSGTGVFHDGLQYIHPSFYAPENLGWSIDWCEALAFGGRHPVRAYHVLAVEVRARAGSDEELRVVRIWATVGH